MLGQLRPSLVRRSDCVIEVDLLPGGNGRVGGQLGATQSKKVSRFAQSIDGRIIPCEPVADITQNTMQSQHRFFQSFAESLTGSAAMGGGLFTIHI